MAIHPNPDRDSKLMVADHGTVCLITDRRADLYIQRYRKNMITSPPPDRFSRPCGGMGGFDDYVERWHE
jgi:hypothetical protein